MKNPKLPSLPLDVPKLQKDLKSKPETYWLKRGERMALRLFNDMVKFVPAYKDFLRKQGFRATKVRSLEDFKKVPQTDKDNYLRQYPRQQLCWNGNFAKTNWVVSTTSGSTGRPYYFPRTDIQDEQYALTAELYLRENFNIQNKTTLYVDAFAMGAWIGGLFTYEAIKRVAEKGYNLTIITPGINKQETINAIKNLGLEFDQVIIGCYPPMMKDIIDLGVEDGLNWSEYDIGLIFSAEGFSEDFRDHVLEQASIGDIYCSNLNHYGTVDMGTMSHETPVSIYIRREALKFTKLHDDLFGGIKKMPTLTQFLPELFYFEEQNNELLCSSYSGLPLVRYNLKDRGGVIKLDHVSRAFNAVGLDLGQCLSDAKISEHKWNLPFVYLFERSDFSVTYIGGIIYPEEIRRALLMPPVKDFLTGKFTMQVMYDSTMKSKLKIHVEMKRTTAESKELLDDTLRVVVDTLFASNSEYVSNYSSYGDEILPQIVLHPHGDSTYFSGLGKQQWVKRT